jgi:hypothetical protein
MRERTVKDRLVDYDALELADKLDAEAARLAALAKDMIGLEWAAVDYSAITNSRQLADLAVELALHAQHMTSAGKAAATAARDIRRRVHAIRKAARAAGGAK